MSGSRERMRALRARRRTGRRPIAGLTIDEVRLPAALVRLGFLDRGAEDDSESLRAAIERLHEAVERVGDDSA